MAEKLTTEELKAVVTQLVIQTYATRGINALSAFEEILPQIIEKIEKGQAVAIARSQRTN